MLAPGIRSLALRCPNWVGDIVMATPAFACLREGLPGTQITALIRPYARGLIEDAPWFDRIVDCDDKSLAGTLQVRAALREAPPEAGLLFTNSTHSWLTFRLAGVKRLYGYRRGLRRWALAGGPPAPAGPEPMQAYYLNLCRHLGFSPPAKPRPALYLGRAAAAAGEALLRGYGIAPGDRVIGMNPGASFGSSKCWPPEHFARLAELLQGALGCKLLLLVAPGEEAIARSIAAQSRARIIDTSRRPASLAELKALVRRCQLLVTNDTGPRHLAVAFGLPVVVLMGPTDPIYTASNLEATTVLRRDLPCSPCHRKTCPLGHHDCMKQVTPEMALAAVRAAL